MAKTRPSLTSSQRSRVRQAAGLPPRFSARKSPTNPARPAGYRGFLKSIRPTIAKRTGDFSLPMASASVFSEPHEPRVGSRFVTTRTVNPKSGRITEGVGRKIKVRWGKPKQGKSYTVSTLSREQRATLGTAKKMASRRNVYATLHKASTRMEGQVLAKELSVAMKGATTAYNRLRRSYNLGKPKNAGKGR